MAPQHGAWRSGARGCISERLAYRPLVPTIVAAGAFRVLVLNPPREHGPAHVHVLKGRGGGESEVLVNLGQADVPGASWQAISLREVRGMAAKDVIRAVRLVETHLAHLRQRWEEIHGTDRNS